MEKPIKQSYKITSEVMGVVYVGADSFAEAETKFRSKLTDMDEKGQERAKIKSIEILDDCLHI